MPITIQGSTNARVGSVSPTMGGFSTAFDGTIADPADRAGSTNMTLGGFGLAFDGQFGASASFDGAIDVTMSGFDVTIRQESSFSAESGFSLSGNVGAGESVTVTRSSGTFGAKDHQATYMFENMESYAAGSGGTMPSGGVWSTNSPTSDSFIDTANSYHGSQSMKLAMPDLIREMNLIDLDTDEAYMSCRHYWVQNTPVSTGSTDAANYKSFVFSGSNSSHAVAPDSYINALGNPGPPSGNGLLNASINGYSGSGTSDIDITVWYPGLSARPFNAWNRIEHYVLLSTPDTYDGMTWTKNNGECPNSPWNLPNGSMNSTSGTYSEFSYQSDKNTLNLRSGDNPLIKALWTHNFQRSYQRIENWFDEYYVDKGTNAQARFEIGPSASFGEDSRNRNPQPYTAWSTNSVTFTINTGPSGISGRVLYFVNGDGVTEKVGVFN